MDIKDLYDIAFKAIDIKALGRHGKSGHVACALETHSGNVYTGVCIDLPCALGLCAEQAAICDMVKNNETVIKKIVAVYEDGSVLAPCGRCREFMVQLDDENMSAVVLLSDMREAVLKELLPERWDARWF